MTRTCRRLRAVNINKKIEQIDRLRFSEEHGLTATQTGDDPLPHLYDRECPGLGSYIAFAAQELVKQARQAPCVLSAGATEWPTVAQRVAAMHQVEGRLAVAEYSKQ